MRIINSLALYLYKRVCSVFSWSPVFVIFISPPLISYHFPASLSATHDPAGVWGGPAGPAQGEGPHHLQGGRDGQDWQVVSLPGRQATDHCRGGGGRSWSEETETELSQSDSRACRREGLCPGDKSLLRHHLPAHWQVGPPFSGHFHHLHLLHQQQDELLAF